MEDDIINIEQLSKLELYWITKLNSYYPNGYNFPYPTEVFSRGKSYKIKHIKTNSITEINNLTDFCKKNKIGVKAMNAMLMGKQIQSHGYCLPETHILPIKKTLKKSVVLENVLTNEIIEINNLTNFCNERKLNYGCLSSIIHKYKDKKSHKGWKLKETLLKKKLIYKNLTFIDPCGKIIFIDNLYKFCKINNLCYMSMYYVASEKYFQYKGWKLEKNGNKKKVKRGKIFKLINFNNDVIDVKNISQFCKDFKIDRTGIDRLLRKEKKEHKGYKLYEL